MTKPGARALCALALGASLTAGGCGQSPDLTGSWIVTNTPSGGVSPPFLSVATFTADGGYVGGAQGSGACCPILTAGHGVWRHSEGNSFLVTFMSVGYDSVGGLMGRLTGRLAIELEASADRFSGEFAGTLLDPTGTELWTLDGTVHGERIDESGRPPGLHGSASTPSADGVPITYEVRGEGSPSLVFVHGWACNRGYWDEQVEHFSDRHRVVTIDLAGHGDSGADRTEWSIAAFAEDVVAVVRALELPEVVLVGHSMGGPVVLEAALRLPGRTLGVVGVDTYRDSWANATAESRDRLLASFRADFEGWTREWVGGRMFEPTTDPELADRITNDMAAMHPEIGVAAMEGLYDWGIDDFQRAFHQLQAPLRIIQAERYLDRLEVVRELEAHLPSFEVMVVPGVGHFVMMEDPVRFNRLLEEAVAGFVESRVPR